MDAIFTQEVEPENSTHKVEVIEIQDVQHHPNADRLDVVKVFEYTCCTMRDAFKVGDLAAYIAPDGLVPTDREEFSFLAEEGKTHARIRAKRLRGTISFGFLIPAPEGSQVGDNVAEQLGVLHYNPPEHGNSFRSGKQVSNPPGFHPVYNIDALLRHSHCLVPGEPVYVTCKLHGSNMRAGFIPPETMGCLYRKTRINRLNDPPIEISAVRAGDKVLGQDADGNVVETTVTNFKRGFKSDNWLEISGTRARHGGKPNFIIRCTPEHRIFSVDANDYVEVRTIKAGDKVLVLDSFNELQESTILYKRLYWDNPNGNIKYDIETETHNYFASDALVHNSDSYPEGPSLIPGAKHIREGAVRKDHDH